jgi:hypothetical protein
LLVCDSTNGTRTAMRQGFAILEGDVCGNSVIAASSRFTVSVKVDSVNLGAQLSVSESFTITPPR